jgi:hypothetical protein
MSTLADVPAGNRIQTGQFHSENKNLQIALDNTSLSVYKECPKKYFYKIIKGYRAPGIRAPLAWGSAYHAVVELYDGLLVQGQDEFSALRASIRLAYQLAEKGFGEDTARTLTTLVRTIVWYAANYRERDPLKTHIFPNGKLGLELSFRFYLPITVANTNDQYVYCGHIDKVAEYANALYAVERKHTTGQLNDEFYARYAFSSQIGGYATAGKICFDTELSGVIIDGAQVLVNSVRFGRRVVHRVHSHLEEWLDDTLIWVKLLEQSAINNYWQHNTESCNKFGGCEFREICSKPPAIRTALLNQVYIIDRWNPIEDR